jgi:hypothetical protein
MIKPIVLITFVSGILTLTLYSRILMDNGMPYEIVPEDWGWLMKGGITGLPIEFGLLLFPSLIVSLLLLKERREIILSSIFLISVLFYVFVSFRINLVVALLGCIILVKVFDRLDRSRFLVLFMFCILNFVLSLALLPSNLGGYADNSLVRSVEYLNTLNYDKVLVDPFYAHYITFNTNKKVLADLYVEYANKTMYQDAEYFARTGDIQIAEKWNINLVFTYHDCGNYSQIYDNGIQRICIKY